MDQPITVPISTSPLQHHSWKDMALFVSASSDEKIKTFSSQQLSGSNPGEVKAGLLNSRSHITSQALFSIMHLLFLCQLLSLWSALSAGASRGTQEHLGHHPLCTAPGTHSSHSRNQTDNVESGFLSSALGFHLLTSVCTGFM